MEATPDIFKIDIRRLGRCSELEYSLAYRVYIHLCEERHLWDVQYRFSEALKKIYLKARKRKDSPEEIYIPVLSSEDLPLATISRCQQELVLGTEDENAQRSIILAICDPGSSVLLYRMTNAMKALSSKPLSKNKMLKQKANAEVQINEEK
ncbi:uncharacterized protein LOC129764493 isoform X2 [Toxorhynchites rutilus septentrionalis]|uniref:uncharacterized protein LOC129764493 isoform X2 n=1 Tax=Toxorhynchites rutilus septentrionalis TaxID=329112 RepID=UPI00247AF27B|nr:uncharacterized protein LOC129764493 isoform X2 [Toxorhynchites rutilus septentrionalis]